MVRDELIRQPTDGPTTVTVPDSRCRERPRENAGDICKVFVKHVSAFPEIGFRLVMIGS